MQYLIFFTLIFVSTFICASKVDKEISIKKIENEYSISYFNYEPEISIYFEKRELQGGGYTWEALVKAVIENEFPNLLSNIRFDSEGDAFFAHVKDEITANKIKTVIEKLSSDIDYREKYFKIAKQHGYLE